MFTSNGVDPGLLAAVRGVLQKQVQAEAEAEVEKKADEAPVAKVMVAEEEQLDENKVEVVEAHENIDHEEFGAGSLIPGTETDDKADYMFEGEDGPYIMELSKKTLSSYIKKATGSYGARRTIANDLERDAGKGGISKKQRQTATKLSNEFSQDAHKRRTGINKAADKLAKESRYADDGDYAHDVALDKKKDKEDGVISPKSRPTRWVPKPVKAKEGAANKAKALAKSGSPVARSRSFRYGERQGPAKEESESPK